jgi:hypothetical protein
LLMTTILKVREAKVSEKELLERLAGKIVLE